MASEENRDKTEDPGLSIGDVARATGISVHTLRVWEKRYGAPFPMKRKSGHRRYAQEEVRRLRLAVQETSGQRGIYHYELDEA